MENNLKEVLSEIEKELHDYEEIIETILNCDNTSATKCFETINKLRERILKNNGRN